MPIVKQLLLFMESYYIKTEGNDLLSEAIPESLKNIVLVLENSGLLSKNSELYNLIRIQLINFLPKLVNEIMQNPPFSGLIFKKKTTTKYA